MSGADDHRWRAVPAPVTRDHLRAMVVREPHLMVEDHLGQLRVVRVADRARWVVGRDPACDLVIDWDASVSRSHAVIERLGSVVTVEDSGFSRNGTVVDGRRAVGKVRLVDASTIDLGYCQLLVRLPDPLPASTATVGVALPAASRPPEFSPAERRVLTVMLEANALDARVPSNREIGERLGVGAETVKSQVRSITQRLQAAGVPGPIDRGRIVALALDGLLEPAQEPGVDPAGSPA